MKRQYWLGIVAVVVIMGLAAVLLRPKESPKMAQKASSEETLTPAPSVEPKEPSPSISEEVMDTLVLSGIVRAGAEATLSTRFPARIVAVNVRQGETAQRGQLLVQLDNAEGVTQTRTARAGVDAAQAQVRKAEVGREAQRVKADADVSAAQSGLRQAQSKLRQAQLARDAVRADMQSELTAAREGVRKAEIGLERAQKTLHDLEELAKVGGVSRNELDGARTQVKVMQADLDAARAQASRLENGPDNSGTPYRVALAQKDADAAQAGVSQAATAVETAREARRQTLALAEQDIQAAEAALKQARAGVAGAQSAESAARLVSPIDGVVSSVGARVGETAQPGMPLVTVVSLSGARVEASVPAGRLARLRVGQAARITVDTQPGRAFSATVSEIARVAEPGGRAFRATFRFSTPFSPAPGQNARIVVSDK